MDKKMPFCLEKPQQAADLTAAERAAIDFADRFATDHLSINDQRFDAMREHFSEAEIMELLLHLALYVGMGRLAATLDRLFTYAAWADKWDGAVHRTLHRRRGVSLLQSYRAGRPGVSRAAHRAARGRNPLTPPGA